MNIHDYISSGILEQYVLGDVSPQEKKEVECMSHIYPEIQQELLLLQQATEAMALQHATVVDSKVKTKLFERINEDIKEQNTTTTKVTPIVDIYKYKKYYQFAVAASIIGIIGCLYFIKNLNNSVATKKQEIATLKSTIETNNSIKNNLTNQINLLTDTATKSYVLVGNTKVNNKNLQLSFNKNTGDVVITSINFPATPTNKQYQLWALKDGKPIDLGVFELTTAIQKMKQVNGAQAFAITIENKGGSPTPTLTELCGLVKI